MQLAGYLIWFAVLVRLLYISTGNPSTDSSEVLGSHLGLAFWLAILSLIPFFIARHRAKKQGTQISWPYVMVGATMLALLLAIGGFYGRSQTRGTTSTTEEHVQAAQHAESSAAKEAVDGQSPTLNRSSPDAWSGNHFDRFDSVQAIEAKARTIPQLNERRAWAAVISWQAFFMSNGDKDANEALYMGVENVLEGFRENKGVCRPGNIIIVDAASASLHTPAGTRLAATDCDRSPQNALSQTSTTDKEQNWSWDAGYLDQPEAGSSIWSLVGEWRCVQKPSSKSTRMILARDGSISSTTEVSDSLIQDPWLHWYMPTQRGNQQMYFVHIKTLSENSIVVKYPSDNIDECIR